MLTLLYNLVVVPLLGIGFRLLALFQPKARRILQEQRNLFPQLENQIRALPPGSARILLHVASAGEYLSALPLIRSLNASLPELKVILSFHSPSLADLPSRHSAGHLETFLPFDTPAAVRRFLDLVEPSLILFASYDIWPNLLWTARRRRIPCALINGILSASSSRFRFPARIFFARLYRNLQLIAAVSEADAGRFAALGLSREKISVTGNCRFDQTLFRGEAVSDQDPDLAGIAPGMWLVAGSTWPEDEARLVPAWLEACRSYPRLGLIIAPHEPGENHLRPIETGLERAGVTCRRYSQLAAGRPMPRAVLVDRVGILYKLYCRGQVAYVGGGFGRGLHNVMEPAGMGLPVIFGPRHLNSSEAIQLLERGGGFAVSSREELGLALGRLLKDPSFLKQTGLQAETVVKENAGATSRTLDLLRRSFPEVFSAAPKGKP